MAENVKPFRADTGTFQQRVREQAADSGKVFVTAHARKRMIERTTSRPEILEALRKGIVVEGPFLSAHGNWQATMRRFAAGLGIEIAAAIDDGVVVVTVYQTIRKERSCTPTRKAA